MDSYYKSEKFQKILQQYEASKNNDTSSFLDAEELTDVAEYYHLIGKEEEAYEVATYALNIFPEATSPLAFSARLALFVEDNPKKAEKLAEQIIDKSDFEYFYLIAEIHIVKDQADQAFLLLQEQMANIDEDERNSFALDAGILFADYDEIDYAAQFLKYCKDTNNNDYKELKGRILKGQGKYEESEIIFNELLDNNPYSGIYWNYLANNQFLRNKFEESITSSEYSIAINPEDEEALLNKANGLFSLGNYKEALKYYLRYKEATTSKDNNVICVTIGHIYLLLNEVPEAYRYYKEAIGISQDKPTTLVHIAMSVFDNGYMQYAYNLFSTYLPQMPSEWNLGYAYFARCCFELGKMDEYKEILVIALHKNIEECTEVLGELYPSNTLPKDFPKLTPIAKQHLTHNNDELEMPF